MKTLKENHQTLNDHQYHNKVFNNTGGSRLLAAHPSSKNTVAEVLLQAHDVSALLEFLLDREATRGPDFQLGVGIKGPSRLNAELSDAPVEHAMISDFGASQPLFIDQDQSVIRENKHVAEDFEGAADLFAGNQNRREVGLNLGVINFSGVAEEMTE